MRNVSDTVTGLLLIGVTAWAIKRHANITLRLLYIVIYLSSTYCEDSCVVSKGCDRIASVNSSVVAEMAV